METRAILGPLVTQDLLEPSGRLASKGTLGPLAPLALLGTQGLLERGATSGFKDHWGALDLPGARARQAKTDGPVSQGPLEERGLLEALGRRESPDLGPLDSQAARAQLAALGQLGREAKWA